MPSHHRRAISTASSAAGASASGVGSSGRSQTPAVEVWIGSVAAALRPAASAAPQRRGQPRLGLAHRRLPRHRTGLVQRRQCGGQRRGGAVGVAGGHPAGPDSSSTEPSALPSVPPSEPAPGPSVHEGILAIRRPRGARPCRALNQHVQHAGDRSRAWARASVPPRGGRFLAEQHGQLGDVRGDQVGRRDTRSRTAASASASCSSRSPLVATMTGSSTTTGGRLRLI